MNKTRFWTNCCSFLSLAISLAMIGFWIFGVWELKVVDFNTFVGVIVSLLAIIVTLAIAWQIYNAVEMKSKIEELKQLEDKFKEQEKCLEQQNFSSGSHINRLSGISAYNAGEQEHAFRFMLSAFINELQLTKPRDIDYFLMMMEQIVNKIPAQAKYVANRYDSIIEMNEQIKSLDNYGFVKVRYEPIYDKFISKVKRDENK